MGDLTAYGSLFAAALIAATILPMQSEALLAGLLLGGYSPFWLVLCAGVGNVLGSVVNWYLGLRIERFRDRRWFPIKPDQLARARRLYHRWGRWSLLLSWVPIIGDPLTMIAGVMGERVAVFVAIVTVAKFGRYLVVVYALV